MLLNGTQWLLVTKVTGSPTQAFGDDEVT